MENVRISTLPKLVFLNEIVFIARFYCIKKCLLVVTSTLYLIKLLEFFSDEIKTVCLLSKKVRGTLLEIYSFSY